MIHWPPPNDLETNGRAPSEVLGNLEPDDMKVTMGQAKFRRIMSERTVAMTRVTHRRWRRIICIREEGLSGSAESGPTHVPAFHPARTDEPGYFDSFGDSGDAGRCSAGQQRIQPVDPAMERA